jgi:hypothetical protein
MPLGKVRLSYAIHGGVFAGGYPMKIKRILLCALLVTQLFTTGCFWSRNRCGGLTRTRDRGFDSGMANGCNECQSFGSPEMFGTPVHGNAMLQAPGHVDERLGNPAKQNAYEGPMKK